jgi:LmbE family N-acetylglucosaminyl deacetylase
VKSLALQDVQTVLLVGAHCDDIEIGCGGTILKLVEERPDLAVFWLVLSSGAERAAEARRSAESFLAGAASPTVVVEDFRERYFPYVGAEIKERFDRLAREVAPDVVFTHVRDDLHQDHRIVSELTYNTFRDHLVLEYEIPKYDGDLGRPNVFVHLEDRHCRRKIETLFECFPSQALKDWFTDTTFQALLRLRGVEGRSPSGLAEAFHCRKAVLS